MNAWMPLAMILAAAICFAESPLKKPEPVKTRVVPARSAKAGLTVEVKVDLEIGSEWHLFSDRPEIPGIAATRLELDASEAYTVDKIVYPKPTPVYSDVFEKDLNFYQGQVSISVMIKLADHAKEDLPINGQLTYQACSDTLCLRPAKVKVSGIQKVTP